MARFQVRYEASGFTEDKSILDATCTEWEAAGVTVTCVAEKTFPHGVVAVVGGYITADDNQGDAEIRVFASVTLLVEAETEQQAESMEPPEGILTLVADMMGADFTGSVVLSLEEHSWEVVEVEPIE